MNARDGVPPAPAHVPAQAAFRARERVRHDAPVQPLSRAFLSTWRGTASTDRLEPALAAACDRALREWSRPLVDGVEFCRHLGQRAPTDVVAEEAIERLRASDLYLACACLQGVPAALQLFDERLLSRVPQHLARMRPDPQLVDDTRQTLRARLFMSSDGKPARIAQYNGLGPLESWLRVAAVRAALNLIESRGQHAPAEPIDDDLLPAGSDVELDYLRERYRSSFADALRRAITALPPNARALLRFRFVDGLTPGHIGNIYRRHRTTVMRQIAVACDELVERTRALVMQDLDLSPSECDSLLSLVRSRLPLTLSSIFRSRAQ